jgi:hypothetical protein
MERQWVMKAYNRRREKLEKALKVAVMSNTSKRTSDRHLLAVAENFLASPFIENALTREMKRQSEHGLEFVAETVSSQLLVKSIIAAKIKEARDGK